MPVLPTGLVRNPNGRYYLRRRIPTDLLPAYGKRKEILKSLGTSDYRTACERHRKEEARLTHEWSEKRQSLAQRKTRTLLNAVTILNELTDTDIERLCNLYENQSLAGDERRREEGNYTLDEIEDYQEGYSAALVDLRRAVAMGDYTVLRPILDQFLSLTRHELHVSEQDYRRLALAFARTAIRTNEALLQRYQGADLPTPPLIPSQPAKPSPRISELVQQFLDDPVTQAAATMWQKHQLCLGLLVKFLKDRPVNEIRQIDIRDFLLMVQRLPPRWNFRKEDPLKLAGQEHPQTLSMKTYEDGYRASLGKFIRYAVGNFADAGISAHLALTVGQVKYLGKRTSSDKKQRPFKPKELVRLFTGPEMKAFAQSRDLADAARYWLPHIGLFTGARVNEICQINPQADVFQNEEGHWFFAITPETESDDDVVKRTKNPSSRRHVPIHSQLIELGFLGYLQALRATPEKRLFPTFKPVAGKASGEAADWFSDFLRELGLRDETPGAQLLGMHAFRHTLLNRALNLGIVGMGEVTGHARTRTEQRSDAAGTLESEEVSAVMRGYQGELDLEAKRAILEKLHYPVTFLPTVWKA